MNAIESKPTVVTDLPMRATLLETAFTLYELQSRLGLDTTESTALTSKLFEEFKDELRNIVSQLEPQKDTSGSV